MRLTDCLCSPRVHISCEVFPPKEFAKLDDARDVVRRIAALSPAYISVTYGAAGRTPHFTRELARTVGECAVTPLAHLTCINDGVDKLDGVLTELQSAGVQNVLALRGDIPQGGGFPDGAHFEHAAELVAHIRARGDFCIGAACYPEGHPEAPDRAADLDYLKRKVDAGVDFLTTQMFFDNATLYHFLYRAVKAGIAIPVSAGVMPVTGAKQIKRIAALSGANLPPRLLSLVDRYGSDPASMQAAGVAYATAQIFDLIANGVTNIHLYTMNRPEIAKQIFENLSPVLGK